MVIPAYEMIALEFAEFLRDVQCGGLRFGSYVWPSYYADDYTQDEIRFAQHQFYNLASAYLKCVDKTEYIVKICSDGVDVIRNIESSEKADNFIDIAGYAACAGELMSKKNE